MSRTFGRVLGAGIIAEIDAEYVLPMPDDVRGIYRQSIGNFGNAYFGSELITQEIERCN